MSIILEYGAAYPLQKLAREQMKERLLKDILFDLQICELEGYDKLEYLTDLLLLISNIIESVPAPSQAG